MSKGVTTVSSLPPARVPNAKVDWALVAAEARRVAPDWVKVDVPLSPAVKASIRQGKYKHVNLDEFDVTTRRIAGSDPVRVHFYVRARQ